jgi:hypothetical protein
MSEGQSITAQGTTFPTRSKMYSGRVEVWTAVLLFNAFPFRLSISTISCKPVHVASVRQKKKAVYNMVSSCSLSLV